MKNLLKILKENKLKITPKRKTIIRYLQKNPFYFTPEQIWKEMKKRYKKIGLPTVYRNLEKFNEIGILTKTKGENRYYYGMCGIGENKIHHHHIMCKKCKRIKPFKECNFNEIFQEIEKQTGFKISEHEFFLKGICEECRKGGET